eukprot:544510-Pyramimonas_sp.AAC.1
MPIGPPKLARQLLQAHADLGGGLRPRERPLLHGYGGRPRLPLPKPRRSFNERSCALVLPRRRRPRATRGR